MDRQIGNLDRFVLRRPPGYRSLVITALIHRAREAIDSMRINLPFSYRVLGVRHGKRNSTGATLHDSMEVHVRDIELEDLAHALTLVDREGKHLETFYHFENAFWIADSRSSAHPFSQPHLMLAGHWPNKGRKPLSTWATQKERSIYRPFSDNDARQTNERNLTSLSQMGFLRLATVKPHLQGVKDEDGNFRFPLFLQDGTVACHREEPEATFRIIEKNAHETDLQAARNHTENNVIAVDGVLYHKVPAPVIYATDSKVDWCFKDSFGRLSERSAYDGDIYDSSAYNAYRIPMTDFSTLEQAFPKQVESDSVMFGIEFIDNRFFEPVDLRKGLAKDIKSVLSIRLDLADKSTAFIAKWCALRDLVETEKVSLDEREPEFYDDAANILQGIETVDDTYVFPGAAMWINREVDLDIEVSAPSRTP